MTPIYQFKEAARIPSGVTADGVMEEHDRVKLEYGKASVEKSVLAVLSHPDKYPNLRAFSTSDPEEALRQVLAEGIRYAYQAVIPVKVSSSNGKGTAVREVRVLFAVKDLEGDIIYEPLEIIRKSIPYRTYLLDQLQKDVETFTEKLKDVISELKVLDA